MMIKINLVALLLLIANSAFSQTKNFIDQPYLETTGKVDTLVIPDRIYLSILISESDTKGKQTVEELEAAMAERLKSVGIDLEKQLKLTDLSSNFKKYFLKKKEILKAKSYELLVYNARSAGQVIYEMEDIGLSNVELERTEYSEIEQLQLSLKSKAIKKAKLQAQSLLRPLNQNVGKAIFVSDFNHGASNMLQGRVTGVSIRGYSPVKPKFETIPIEFEKIKVEGEVNVKFIIE